MKTVDQEVLGWHQLHHRILPWATAERPARMELHSRHRTSSSPLMSFRPAAAVRQTYHQNTQPGSNWCMRRRARGWLGGCDKAELTAGQLHLSAPRQRWHSFSRGSLKVCMIHASTGACTED